MTPNGKLLVDELADILVLWEGKTKDDIVFAYVVIY